MQDKILPIIRSHIGHPDLARLVDEPSTTLADLRINAFDLIGLSMDIEDALSIVITDDECHSWGCVGDVLECVAGKVGVGV